MNSLLALSVICILSTQLQAHAGTVEWTDSTEPLQVSISEITQNSDSAEIETDDLVEAGRSASYTFQSNASAPSAADTPSLQQTGPVQISDIIALGEKIWNFILENKPSATFKVVKTSVVPNGVSSWTQLSGWSKPVSKLYHVQFTDIFGGIAGGFDYRITFLYGGNYKGKGKYIGQLYFVPSNVKLHTDRTLNVTAEMSDPLNFGTEEDPIAAVDLRISWTSPTTTRFVMSSAEYFLYGTGEIDDLTGGTN